MPSSLPSFLSPRWQWPTMILAIAVIVIGPFLFIRWTTLEADEASRAVKHGREVESRMLWIAADTRSPEAAALTLTRGIDSPLLQERIQQAHARVPPNLERVLELTRDNPEQPVRLGALRSHVEERTARAMAVIAKGGRSRSDQSIGKIAGEQASIHRSGEMHGAKIRATPDHHFIQRAPLAQRLARAEVLGA